MAVSMVFPGQVFGSNVSSKALKGLPLSVYKRTGQQTHAQTNMNRMLKYSNKGNTTRIRPGDNNRLHAIKSSTNNSSFMPSDTIEQFYECINNKNVTQLGKYLANDCVYEDFSFPKPFQGKKEVLNYFQQLTKCMGDNIEFNADIISKGDDEDGFTIAVNWHLDWNKIQIPFTKGFSLFVLSKEGERLLIKKVQVVTEPPLKPGTLALNLLKIVTSVFDEFPEFTKWFLRSPHVVLLRIYNLVLAPFVKPLLACYINLWKLIATAFIFAFNVYLQISKLFNK
ncbi:Nuclear transport factor 2 (NTF2) family protein [Heracleum sosnowskyi]|uniref:Nuclear transport factor 2 (NTF2) family protein n=1 Tax=Heracleum sosnowskyi TaxID=360622 RepID=A0AAD8HS12_9APIA|nr:Nuclear transport factor 2 (NTF2) family protein [Heracleum sosnowskyi]